MKNGVAPLSKEVALSVVTNVTVVITARPVVNTTGQGLVSLTPATQVQRISDIEITPS